MTIRHLIISALVIAQTALNSSCGQSSSTVLPAKKKAGDAVGVVYEFDTTKYVRHQSGFYLSKSRDIFQLNRLTYDDSTGFWSTHYWLDSLMFYGPYPNRKPLKDIIDMETFTTDTASRFEKDKNHVYYARATSDGVYRYIVNRADPETFKPLGIFYGKDKYKVFYGSDIVKNADLATFHVLNDQDSASDKRYKYYLGERVP